MKLPPIFWPASMVVLLLAAPAGSRPFADASADIEQKLETSLRDLEKERGRIASEKIPLSKEIAELESEVLSLRREWERKFKARDDGDLALSKLESQVKALEDQADFVDSRLLEFVRDFEGRLHISELPRYEEMTAKAKLADKKPGLDTEGRTALKLAVVEAALGRLQDRLGGHVFEGDALSPDGVLTHGKFVALGPTMFYASDDGTAVGLAETQANAADPVVVALPSGFEDGIIQAASSGTGSLPLDATLGKAIKKVRAEKTLGEYVEDGGFVGNIILALGTAALALTLFKIWEILGFRTGTPEDVDKILNELAEGDRAGAAERAERVPGAAGEMLLTGVEHAAQQRGVLEELLFEKILKVRPRLERFLPFLAITAGASPLLGLLGTVSGMIETFQLITIFGTGDARNLSSGISEALVTTAMGLIVAIPTLILHGLLSRMAKRKLTNLEQVSVAFVSGVGAIREERLAEVQPA